MFGFGLSGKNTTTLLANLRSKRGTLNANAVIKVLSQRLLTPNQKAQFNASKINHYRIYRNKMKKRAVLRSGIYAGSG
jgi:hypothetical protein